MNLNHRDLCHQATLWLMKKDHIDIAGWEIQRSSGIVDAAAVSIKNKRIYIIECKRTRADLLQDLNKKKMLRYESASSHCYLLGTKEAFNLDKLTYQEVIEDLTSRGLPKHWGILLQDKEIKVIRRSTQHSSVKENSIRLLLLKIGRAHMYRHMNQLNLLS